MINELIRLIEDQKITDEKLKDLIKNAADKIDSELIEYYKRELITETKNNFNIKKSKYGRRYF